HQLETLLEGFVRVLAFFFGGHDQSSPCLGCLRRERAHQTRPHTISSRISAWNRWTLSPRIVEHRPSLSLKRQRCRGQPSPPSSTQPGPSEPPAWGQRSRRATIAWPSRTTARSSPPTWHVRPPP